MSPRRRLLALAAVVIALATTAITTSAYAASAPTSLPVGQFTLSADYHRYDAVNSALTAKLGTAAVHTVMDNANHDRGPISDSLGLAGYTGGFTFDSGDESDCTNYPQGITSSRDAIGTADSGNYDGHQLILVSWYTKAGCDGAQSRSRITLVDWDATYPNSYRKVLLVEPTGTTAAPSFTDIPVHAGGVSWYGDYLYVADTGHGMRVFNMKDILKTNTGGTAGQIGRQSNGTTYYAHNYAYVLPQIGTITASTTSGTPLAWSSISLDRVSGSIVMTEYTCQSGCTDYPNRPARAIRFPFASGATTFAATTTASEALQLPWYKLNGVASHNGRWWFNSSGAKQLYYWTPATGSHTYAWVGGGESISYWEDTTNADLLWSLQETVGHRNVFAVEQASYGPERCRHQGWPLRMDDDGTIVAAARAGDGSAFAALVERHRGELRVHCYRMLGSFDEAEDLVQETFLRAWKHLGGFEGRATFRAWLYRIATNACLDALDGRAHRVLPQQLAPPSGPDADLPPRTDVAWLQPFPDRLAGPPPWEPVAPGRDEPDAVVVARETLELAFLAAIQHLPPRQRAVVILRDVLGWPARQTAELLDGSVASVNSALQRARATLREHLPGSRLDWTPPARAGERERAVLRRYMDAMERSDLAAVADLLAEDVRAAMPPFPAWFEGRDAVLATLSTSRDPGTPYYLGRFRLVPTAANHQPAVATYLRRPGDTEYRPFAITVLRIDGDRIAELTAFHDLGLFPAFALPAVLPAALPGEDR